jgi:NDP-sugar pyrophosphorylase family protein
VVENREGGRAEPVSAGAKLPVAILAGGLATRLRPITEKIPKVLLSVAGKPFLSHQLELLVQQGIERAVLCVGYLGEMIERDFGDGSRHGLRLDYSFDGPVLLGTGGALQKALPLLGDKFFVLYGDSYLPIDLPPIAECFERSGKLGLMTVFHNENKFDTSNVWYENGEIKVYDKKNRLPQMRHIDCGLSIFSRAAFAEFPSGQAFDLADIMGRLVKNGQMCGFEIKKRFYEIGSPEGLAELEALLSGPK